jgi:uncharacterized protein (TIRG00374 family)
LAPVPLSLERPRDWIKRPRTQQLLQVGGYVIAALCLIWVFRGINFKSFVHQFEILEPVPLCIAVAFSTAVYFVNSLRWMLLLRPLGKVSYGRTLQSVYIGLFCNEVLPLRPGELIRCYLLSRWSALPLASMFASAAVERILDGICLMVGFFAVACTMRLPRPLVTGALILGACLVVLAAVWMSHAARARTHRTGAPHEAKKAMTRFLHALACMGNVRVALPTFAVSCLSLGCLILAMWFLMRGGRIGLSLAEAAAVFLIIRVGTVIPSAPGNIGSYQFFCVLGMGLFGINKSAAAAFSLLVYSAFTLPLLIGGAIAVAASGLKLKSLVVAAES